MLLSTRKTALPSRHSPRLPLQGKPAWSVSPIKNARSRGPDCPAGLSPVLAVPQGYRPSCCPTGLSPAQAVPQSYRPPWLSRKAIFRPDSPAGLSPAMAAAAPCGVAPTCPLGPLPGPVHVILYKLRIFANAFSSYKKVLPCPPSLGTCSFRVPG